MSDGSFYWYILLLTLQLDDWVLCRIYNKKGSAEKQHTFDQKSMKYPELEDQKPKIISTVQNKAVPSSLPSLPPIPAPPTTNDYLYFETSDSVPRLHTHTDSSGSEQVMSPEKEVQSEPKWNDFDFSLYMDGFANDPFASQAQFSGDLLTSSWQDMLMFSNKSFWLAFRLGKFDHRTSNLEYEDGSYIGLMIHEVANMSFIHGRYGDDGMRMCWIGRC